MLLSLFLIQYIKLKITKIKLNSSFVLEENKIFFKNIFKTSKACLSIIITFCFDGKNKVNLEFKITVIFY